MSAMTADAGEVTQRSFREVWVISLGHALTHWYPATFYLLLPLIGKELGLDYAQIGSILTAQYAAGAIANVPGGILVDTIGRKGLDDSILASYNVIDDPLGPKNVTPTPIYQDADEVCLHGDVEPYEDDPSRGACAECGEEFDLATAGNTEDT